MVSSLWLVCGVVCGVWLRSVTEMFVVVGELGVITTSHFMVCTDRFRKGCHLSACVFSGLFFLDAAHCALKKPPATLLAAKRVNHGGFVEEESRQVQEKEIQVEVEVEVEVKVKVAKVGDSRSAPCSSGRSTGKCS